MAYFKSPMKTNSELFSRGNFLMLITLLIFLAGFLIATNWGTSLKYSSDSIWIRSLAENFGSGKGLVGLDGSELIYWVPIYPLLLSIWYEEINLFAIIINLVSIIGTFTLSNLTFNQALKLPFSRNIYMTSLMLSTPLLMISVFLWTETLFLFLLMLFIYSLTSYLSLQNKYYLAMLIIAGWLMLIVRNAGIFFIPGILVWVFLQKERTMRDKPLLIFSILLVISGFAVWNIYKIVLKSNLHILSELLPTFTPIRNLMMVSSEIGKYFMPDLLFFPSSIGGLIFIGLVTFKAFKPAYQATGLVYFMVLGYILTFIIIPPDPSEISRYLSPIIPIALFVFSQLLTSVLINKHLNPWLGRILLLTFFSYSFIRIIKNSFIWGQVDIIANAINLYH